MKRCSCHCVMREVHPMGIFLFSAKRCLGYRNRLQIAGSHTARLLQHCSSSVCFDRSRRQYLISRRCPLRWLVVCRDIKTQIVQLSQATANDVCAHYGSTWSLKHYYCPVILAAYQSYSSKCLCFVIFQNDCNSAFIALKFSSPVCRRRTWHPEGFRGIG